MSAEQGHGPEIPDVAPVIPSGARPAGADSWSSADSPSGPEAPGQAKVIFSAQSERVIKAIEEGLEDPECTQIDGYGPGKISAQFRGHNQLLEGLAFSSVDEYEAWLKQMVDESGAVTTWQKLQNDRHGVLNLPAGGRLTIFMPPIATGAPTFSLRKHVAAKWQPIAFVENGTLSAVMMDFLRSAVAARVNMLFVGTFGSGKTTLLRALAQGMNDEEKIGVVEQVPELGLTNPFAIPYLYQPSVEGMDLDSVLDEQMYNGLDHLIVGEVHMAGITKMLETMIITDGSMSTYHAFSTEQAGERMKIALQIENHNVSAETAVAYIRQAIDLVVVLEEIEGQRRVLQITELDWRASGGHAVLGGQDLFVLDRKDGKFKSTGVSPDPSGRIAFKFSKYGLPLPQQWFTDVEAMERFQKIAAEHR